MKKKNVVIALAVTAALTVPFSVFAATSDTTTAKGIRGFFAIDASKLTDQQKADVDSYAAKMADLRKQFIDQMVKNGAITQAQGDAEKSRIDEALRNGNAGGFLIGGRGLGKEAGMGMGGLNIDTSKLTDQQKADLKATAKKIIDLEKSYVAKAVANGLITADQSAKLNTMLDSRASNIDSNSASASMKEFMGGFDGFMFFGKGIHRTTALTDQQKTDLTAFVKDLSALKKEMVNKLVSYGILTKAQGDSESSRIDEMTQAQIDNGFTGGMTGKGGMMDKGGMMGFRGRGMRGFDQGSTNSNTGGTISSTPSAASTGTSVTAL